MNPFDLWFNPRHPWVQFWAIWQNHALRELGKVIGGCAGKGEGA